MQSTAATNIHANVQIVLSLRLFCSFNSIINYVGRLAPVSPFLLADADGYDDDDEQIDDFHSIIWFCVCVSVSIKSRLKSDFSRLFVLIVSFIAAECMK